MEPQQTNKANLKRLHSPMYRETCWKLNVTREWAWFCPVAIHVSSPMFSNLALTKMKHEKRDQKVYKRSDTTVSKKQY